MVKSVRDSKNDLHSSVVVREWSLANRVAVVVVVAVVKVIGCRDDAVRKERWLIVGEQESLEQAVDGDSVASLDCRRVDADQLPKNRFTDARIALSILNDLT